MSGSRVLVSLRISAPRQRTFDAFIDEIGDWWRPNRLFRFTDRVGCRLAFEPDPPQHLVEIGPDGSRFHIGEVRVWQPPERIVFGWRQAGFDADQDTEVSVRFAPIDTGTLVTVEHTGWDAIPQHHVARHGFPLGPFQRRNAEWWQALLASLHSHLRFGGTRQGGTPMSAFDGEYEPSAWDMIADEVARYERSGGSEPSDLVGDQWIILWTLGARSGKVRKTPLVRTADGNGNYAVIGSQGGAPTNPSWVHNLRANPVARLQDGPTVRDFRVREAEGDEKASWWARAMAVWPSYDEYQAATDRTIPLFVLEPTD